MAPKRKRSANWSDVNAESTHMMLPEAWPLNSNISSERDTVCPVKVASNQTLPKTENNSATASRTQQPPAKVSSIEDIFGALGTWTSLPPPEAVKNVVMVDFTAMLPMPVPNPRLIQGSSIKVLDSGLGDKSWPSNPALLRWTVQHQNWNQSLVELVQFACQNEDTLVVVNTGWTLDQTPLIKQELERRGIQADMYTHSDPLQPSRTRKTQLVTRLWAYFCNSTFLYYEQAYSVRDSRDLRAQFQALADYERPVPQLFEVYNSKTHFDPVVEREFIKEIISDCSVEAFISTQGWLWQMVNYEDVVAALKQSLVYQEQSDIVDYKGRTMDYQGDTTPLLGDIGQERILIAHSLRISGQNISLIFPDDTQLIVSRLKHRADEDSVIDIGKLEIKFRLQIRRQLVIQ